MALSQHSLCMFRLGFNILARLRSMSCGTELCALHKAGTVGARLAFPYLDLMPAASTAISFRMSSAVIFPSMICAPPAAAGASAEDQPTYESSHPMSINQPRYGKDNGRKQLFNDSDKPVLKERD